MLTTHNVPGLLTHDQGRTFSSILATLNDLGYRVEWMVLTARISVSPRFESGCSLSDILIPDAPEKILPVFGTNGKTLIQILGGSQGYRVYDPRGTACTQTAGGGGKGVKTGLYLMEPDSAQSCFVDLCIGRPTPTENARCLTARYSQTTLCNHRGERSGSC